MRIKSLQAEPRFRKLWQHTNEVNGEVGLKQRFLATYPAFARD